MLNSPVLSLWLPWSYFSRLLRSCIGTVGLFSLPRPHSVYLAHVYAKVAKITWNKEMTSKNMGVMNSAGNTVTEPEEVRETWRQFIESLYDKYGKPKIEDLQVIPHLRKMKLQRNMVRKAN